ncbi:MAG: hypothetical protein M3Q07_07690 [Pseudobdellovibrionaceae bacterium]|nr:hypothetical protein [Pseudobdellovibrionaceae bacterium]
MTTLFVQTYLIGNYGAVPLSLEMKRFSFCFQARSWLLLNGYMKGDGGSYKHFSNGSIATLYPESRRQRP